MGVELLEGILMSIIPAAGRVTAKLAPVVIELPLPGKAETAGLTVPLMEILHNSWTGEVAPPLV